MYLLPIALNQFVKSCLRDFGIYRHTAELSASLCSGSEQVSQILTNYTKRSKTAENQVANKAGKAQILPPGAS